MKGGRRNGCEDFIRALVHMAPGCPHLEPLGSPHSPPQFSTVPSVPPDEYYLRVQLSLGHGPTPGGLHFKAHLLGLLVEGKWVGGAVEGAGAAALGLMKLFPELGVRLGLRSRSHSR